MKILLSLTTLLLTCNMSFAQTQKISWLEGSWTGDGYQPNALSQQNWSINLQYRQGQDVIIYYPTFPCSGNWEFVKGNKRKAQFIERITDGTDKCANNLKVVVKRAGKNQIRVSYIVPENGTVDATGVLKKK